MYKTLLVPVDGRPRSGRSIELAGRIAGAFDAHVVGLFIQPQPAIPGVVYGRGGSRIVAEIQENMVREASEAAQVRFDAEVKKAAIASAEWRVAQGDRADLLALHARYADLVVINQTDSSAEQASNFADAVVLSLGRPALLVPYTCELKTFARRVLVCWNASRESARAVTDALPLLQRAALVTVMTVNGRSSRDGHGEEPGTDIALFLARHGVKAQVIRVSSAGVNVGSVILSRAFDLEADMVVMGAYGHARLRELVLGGATRTLLQSMTVPVLMSH